MLRMRQTTVYLPDDLKQRLEQAAHQDRRSEASIVREALQEALDRRVVTPTAPLFETGWGEPTIAERVDELLDETGFGS
ncbi:ribbon-helix-helix domain-containing protein [Candidatus Poriferisocius sp.]|uniref:ribbon-helix-helix domain-containing protein n=1 Tax=Candidatus Poriferisocius sp. TaxID=3101276 RepID=UPI003B58CEEA